MAGGSDGIRIPKSTSGTIPFLASTLGTSGFAHCTPIAKVVDISGRSLPCIATGVAGILGISLRIAGAIGSNTAGIGMGAGGGNSERQGVFVGILILTADADIISTCRQFVYIAGIEIC